MKLRVLFGIAVISLAAMVALSAIALVVLTSEMDSVANDLADSSAGIRAAEGLVRNLLVVDREDHLFRVTGSSAHKAAREEAESHLARWRSEVRLHVGSEDEQKILDRADRAIAEYLADVNKPNHDQGGALIASAVSTATQLADYNEDEALAARG